MADNAVLPTPAPSGRAITRIPGFDQLAGGLPAGRTTLVAGGAGAGKTIFALQALIGGTRQGEPGVFVSFEETRAGILANMRAFDWALDTLSADELTFLEANLPLDAVAVGDFDIQGLLASLDAVIERTGARRVVFDAIDGLLILLGDTRAQRREISRLLGWARERGLTTIITVKTDAVYLDGAQQELLQFLSECVVRLQHRLVERTATRSLQIVKFRGAEHSASEYPMAIGREGIFVSGVGATTIDHKISTERVSTGIARLDAMLGGGYYRGSSVLIAGEPGTAKSTLSAVFAAAATRRGEKTLYISFDEAADQIVRNMTSLGMDLAATESGPPPIILGLRVGATSAEEHFMAIRRLIAEHAPQNLIIDPVSALAKASGLELGIGVTERLLDFAKSRGITVIFTTLLDSGSEEDETTRMHVSTIADTWMSLSFRVRGGERNRALTIIKSRGTPHSNQVRELLLSSDGVTLADVYSGGGDVLMGTARLEKEREQLLFEEQRHADYIAALRANDESGATLKQRLIELQHELKANEAERRVLQAREEGRARQRQAAHVELLDARRADAKTS
jgi:circadian clock protein KaiC